MHLCPAEMALLPLQLLLPPRPTFEVQPLGCSHSEVTVEKRSPCS